MSTIGPNTLIHPTAIVDESIETIIGEGCRIWHFCHVLPHTTIGRNCSLGQNVMVGPSVFLGDNVKVQNNVSIYEGVTLEDDVFIGPSAVFTNVINPRSHIRRRHELRRTLIRKGATVGANATIVCGVEIGRYAFIGAGAVVTHNIPDYVLVVGNPARMMGWVCKCGERLPIAAEKFDLEKAACGYCLATYSLHAGRLSPIL